jgi:hypothetical protein
MKTNPKRFTSLAAAIATCLLLTHHVRAAGATLVEVGILTGSDSSYAFGLSDSGRATGGSFGVTPPSANRCFRTGPMSPLNESYDPSCNVHAYLSSTFWYIMTSTGYGIEQSGSGPIQIAGELVQYNTTRAFWYYDQVSYRTARLLSLPYQGTANSAVAIKTTPWNSAAVVGHSWVNGRAQACYWAESTSGEWLYNYGNAYWPNSDSWATDTDVNRTIGYYQDFNRPIPFIVDGSTGPKYDLPVGGGNDGAFALGMYTSANTSYIVGYTFQFSQRFPCVWTYTGNGNVSQVLIENKFGYADGIARSINDSGQIVGSVSNIPYPNSGYDEKACFWRLSDFSGGLLNNQGTFNMDLVRAYKVASSSTSSRVAGIGVKNGLARGFILDHAD